MASSSTAYVVKKSDAPETTPQPGYSYAVSSSAPTQPYVLPNAHPDSGPSQPPLPPPPSGFQANSGAPGAANRRDGAAFVPYSSAAAAALEKPKDQRSWLVPVIIGAAVVLLGLVLASAYLVISGKGGTASNTQQQISGSAGTESDMSEASPTALPAGANDELKLRDVIYRSNENQIESWKNLDEDVLKKNYTGVALQENINQVQELKKQGMFAVPHNESLQILDVKVDGDTATAHTQEKWTVNYYNLATKALITRQSYSLSETYHFVKKDGTWYINQLDIPETTPTTVPGTSG